MLLLRLRSSCDLLTQASVVLAPHLHRRSPPVSSSLTDLFSSFEDLSDFVTALGTILKTLTSFS